MMLSTRRPVVTISDTPHGFQVNLAPRDLDGFFEDHGAAQTCARLLAAAAECNVVDQSMTTLLEEACGDERVGHCPIGDITYLGDEQPMIHNDERLDMDEYEPSIDEYGEGVA